jgi:predicted enzyme related to lactoylglutathione lyase
MAQNIKLFVYPVKDLETAKKIFTKFLGVNPYVDSDYYVGYRVGDQEIGLDPNSSSATPIGYIDVEDIKKYLQDLVDVGAEIVSDIKDVGQGLLVAQVKDTDGNILGLRQSTSLNKPS